MIVKKHISSEGRKIVAICDKELLGKKFEEGNLQLDLSSLFYKGEEKSDDEINRLIKGAYIVNLVGKRSIDFALNAGIINENNVVRIDGIPHAQAILG